MGTVEFEIQELAVFVTLRNACSSEQSLSPCLQAAIASGYAMLGAKGHRFPASTFTQGTNFRGNFHDLGFVPCLNFALGHAFRASGKAGVVVYIL